tara:strand:+ start:1463 stop:2230 length:768 start_codon:yes stop_codon:yes gene_type:complete
MGIVTNDVKVGTGNLPKSFTPGNHVCCINNISLRWPEYLKRKNEKAYEIVLDLETKPIGESFEGWLVDAKDEKGPRYKGQTGRIKTRKWPYKDGSWSGGGKEVTFSMIDDILKFIKQVEVECGSDFLMRTSDKYDTIEEIVEAFNKDKPFKDIFLSWCIGGEQDTNDEGHPKYFLSLPKYERGYKLFSNEKESEHVLPFDKALHVEIKGGAAPVNSFPASTPNAGGADDLWDKSSKDDDPFAVDPNVEDPFDVAE